MLCLRRHRCKSVEMTLMAADADPASVDVVAAAVAAVAVVP